MSTITGTRLYYGEVDGGEPATQLEGIKQWVSLPGTDDIEGFDTTQRDKYLDGEIDWTKTSEPGHQDQGNLTVNFTDDDDLFATLVALKRLHKAFKVLFTSGAWQELPDGWVQNVSRIKDEEGAWTIQLKVKANSEPVMHAA